MTLDVQTFEQCPTLNKPNKTEKSNRFKAQNFLGGESIHSSKKKLSVSNEINPR